MRYWIFKMARDDANPAEWLRKGATSADGSGHRLVNQRPAAGDRCFYWQTARARQLFALATITRVHRRNHRIVAESRADTGAFSAPLTIDELRTIRQLKETAFLRPGYSATFYAIDPAVARLLYQLCVANAPLYAGTWSGIPDSSREARAAWRTIAQTRASAPREADRLIPKVRDKKQWQARLTRAGQARFRQMLCDATGGRCEISGCQVLSAMDACHIQPHSRGGSYDPSNGVLLRTDIHALIDAGLIRLEPRSLRISCAPALAGTEYWAYHDSKLAPRLDGSRPREAALRKYWGRA